MCLTWPYMHMSHLADEQDSDVYFVLYAGIAKEHPSAASAGAESAVELGSCFVNLRELVKRGKLPINEPNPNPNPNPNPQPPTPNQTPNPKPQTQTPNPTPKPQTQGQGCIECKYMQ